MALESVLGLLGLKSGLAKALMMVMALLVHDSVSTMATVKALHLELLWDKRTGFQSD